MAKTREACAAFAPPSVTKPWLKYYSRDDLKKELPQLSMHDYLHMRAAPHMDSLAIRYYKKTLTYREFFENIASYADSFTAWGIKAGEVVSFIAVSTPEILTALYALNKLGAVVNLIDPRMDVNFIIRMMKEAKSRFAVCLDATYAKAFQATEQAGVRNLFVFSVAQSMPMLHRLAIRLKVGKHVLYNNKVVSLQTFLSKKKVSPKRVGRGDDVAAIAYTGGTTGFPKGVMFTNTSINAVAFNFRYSHIPYQTGQSFLGIIPVFTSYGLACGMHMPLCLGVGLIPVPKFQPLKFGKLVRTYRPNHMVSTPAFYEMLMNSKELRRMDLSFLITLGSGGDTMNEGLEEKFTHFLREHKMNYPIAQGYGLSEMSSAVTFCANDVYKAGSVGIPSITTTVGIFDPETQEELPPGVAGEVCATGPNMMKGYFGNAEETAHIMRKHGDGRLWIHSGDLGYLDEDGFLFISGRFKRMITRFDGHKVFPVTIESVVSAREDVQNCCVIGVKDRGHGQGEYPLVLVTLHHTENEEAVCREIFAECEKTLEERGRPVAVLAVKEIPLTGMGKNDYRTLEKEFSAYDYEAFSKA